MLRSCLTCKELCHRTYCKSCRNNYHIKKSNKKQYIRCNNCSTQSLYNYCQTCYLSRIKLKCGCWVFPKKVATHYCMDKSVLNLKYNP